MQINAWLARSTQQLTDAGITTARLDCLVLLEEVLNKNRTHILAHSEDEITEVEQQKLDRMVGKRTQHIPLAYIRGKTEFYGRVFAVNSHVLEPRPESETMIDLLTSIFNSKLVQTKQTTIADIGTGSGALAITAKLEHPSIEAVGIDIDNNCLEVARKNAVLHHVELELLHGNLTQPLVTKALRPNVILLCNLPYVPDNFQINTAATHEPRQAIFGGPDGLTLYRQLFEQLADLPSVGYVLCESMPPQQNELAQIARQSGYELLRNVDFIQLFRKC